MTGCNTAPSCLINLATSCNFYNGALLPTLNIVNGDNMTAVLKKLDDFLAAFDGGGTETSNTKTDSNSILITLTGTAGRNIQADARVSGNTGNKLSILSSGLFAAPATSSLSFDSTTGVLTSTIDGVPSTATITVGNYSETVYGS